MKQHRFVPAEDPLYPSSDGLPLAENDWQLRAIHDAFRAFDVRYANRPDVYVTADLLIYYEEGSPSKRVAPDVFVVFGAVKHMRNVYKLWEEPKAPDFVLEVVASRNTREEALGWKRDLYAELGVREYWLFDPKDEYLDPPLRGLVLRDGAYRPLPALMDNGARKMRSEVLGLDLCAERGELRFWDPVTAQYLKTLFQVTAAKAEAIKERDEATKALAREKAARAQEESARLAAEARIAELEARLR